MDHQKDRKKDAWRSIIFFSVIILIFTVADLLNKERLYSEAENRMLAQKPEFSAESFFSGEFTSDYEEYLNDQFVSRDLWIRMKTGMDMLLQKKLINGVYLAEDDYLIEQHTEDEFPKETVDKRIQQLSQLVEQFPETEVMLVPTADNILTEKLPGFAPYYDDTLLIEQVKETIGEDHVIDVYDALRAHADEGIYYRTDHHWTSLGAYYAYNEWVDGRFEFPVHYKPENMIAVTEEFQGTLQAMINMDVEGEEIHIFKETLRRPVKIVYDFTVEAESFYEEKHLKTKNKYGYFLDDNHGLVEIETKNKSGGELFIIKDSYANTFIPLIANHYSKVYVLDLRYYNGKLFPLIEQYDQGDMEVLVLYNCAHFVSDFHYY